METTGRLTAVCQFTFCAACVATVNRCIFPLRSEQKGKEQTVFLKATGTKVSEPKPTADLTTCALLCESFPHRGPPSMPLPPQGSCAIITSALSCFVIRWHTVLQLIGGCHMTRKSDVCMWDKPGSKSISFILNHLFVFNNENTIIGTTSLAIICLWSTAQCLLADYFHTDSSKWVCLCDCVLQGSRLCFVTSFEADTEFQVKNCDSFAGYFIIRCGVRSTAFIFSLFLVCDMNSSESRCLSLNCRNVWSQTAQSPGPSWDSLVHWNDSFNDIYIRLIQRG